MYFFIFMLGCCIGSFLNVVIYRLPRNENFITGRSYCPYCKQQLTFLEMIPVVSHILLKGRCRTCHHKISLQYPIVETLSGILLLLCITKTGFNTLSLIYYLTCITLLIISVIDLHTMIIPDSLSMILVFLTILHVILYPQMNIIIRTLGFFIISLPLYLLSLYKEAFGGGDIKLMAIMGYMLGSVKIVIAFICALLLAGVYSLFLLLFKKKKIKSYIPLAPFLSFGIILSIFFSNQILYLYLSFL